MQAEKPGSVHTYTYNGDGLLVAQTIDGVETVFIPLALRVTWDLALELPQVLARSRRTRVRAGPGPGSPLEGAWPLFSAAA